MQPKTVHTVVFSPTGTSKKIAADIAHGEGWVLVQGGCVIAYGAVIFGGEAAYARIDGAWLTDGRYVVVHRLAVADEQKARGVATEFMRRTEALAQGRGVPALRIDTNFDNSYMLRLVEKLGYSYCGKVRYASGERLAFEKRL